MIGITTVCNYFDVPAIRLPSQYDKALIRVRIKSIETGRSLETRLDLLKMSADGKAYVAVDGDVMHIGEAVAWEVTLAVSGQDLQDWFHSVDEVPLSEWPIGAHARAHGPAPEGACAGARLDVEPEEAENGPQEPEGSSEDTVDVPEAEGPQEAEEPESLRDERPSREEILEVMKVQGRAMTVREILAILNILYNDTNRVWINSRLSDMEDGGLVKRAGSASTGGRSATIWVVA